MQTRAVNLFKRFAELEKNGLLALMHYKQPLPAQQPKDDDNHSGDGKNGFTHYIALL